MNPLERFSNWLNRLESQGLESAEYPYPITEHGGKIGIHSLQPANCVAYTRQLNQSGARFPVVKAVGDIDWLADIKAIDPEIITIARFEIPGIIGEGVNGIENVNDSDYSVFVNTLFAPIETKLRDRPDMHSIINYWEICNEPDPPDADGWRKLAECMIACMVRAERLGIKLAIFAFNAGTPEWWEMEEIIATGVFGVAKAGGHILTSHEAIFGFENGGWDNPVDLWYGHPIPVNQAATRWVQVREDGLHFFDFAGRISDRPDWWDDGVAGPLLYRYRFLYELLLERDEVIPLVVSEIVYGGGYDSVEDVRARVEWYDEKSADDFYVLAHLPFTLGGIGYGWDKQEYAYAYPTFIDYMLSVRDRPNADQPLLPPTQRDFAIYLPSIAKLAIPNKPDPILNRIVILNLLPAIATLDEKMQVLEATHFDKEGVIQSALAARELVVQGQVGSHVKAWEPQRWKTDIRRFMADGFVDVELLNLVNPANRIALSEVEDEIRPIHVNLLPPDMTLDEKRIVVQRTHGLSEPIVHSADDAISLTQLGGNGSKIKVWEPQRWAGDILRFLRDNGANAIVMTLKIRRKAGNR